MWNHKLALSFAVLGGLALGIVLYSYRIYYTNIAEDFFRYCFGLPNFMTVLISSASVLSLYILYFLVGIVNKEVTGGLLIWSVVLVLLAYGLSNSILMYNHWYD
ncbi:MAG: hypothetical protein MK212_03830 [Saprospiraceae bacterium]|nr:hypothetical protein [Saprospiraceae bacterium]